MDLCRVERAAKLLAKARSTDSQDEAIALVEQSCRLLATVITAASGTHGAPGPFVDLWGGPGLGRGPDAPYGLPAEDVELGDNSHLDVTV